MIQKKYLPFLVLLAAVLLLLYIKQHQRGKRLVEIDEPVHIKTGDDKFRQINQYNYTKHAKCRMACRHIDESEVSEIIQHGSINYNKIEEDARGKTYPIEGITHDKQHVRIVIAPKNDELVIVTVIDLDTDWSCDCK